MKLYYKTTLTYYDKIELFEANDEIGGKYLGLLYDVDSINDYYILIGVDPKTLVQFKLGEKELREIFEKRIQEKWYTAIFNESLLIITDIEEHLDNVIDEKYLPSPGLFLHDPFVQDDDEETIKNSRIRNNTVINLHWDSVNTIEHSSQVSKYTKLLVAFQRCVRRAISYLSIYNLNLSVIVPALPGSISVMLEASTVSDLFLKSNVEEALKVLDFINEDTNNIQGTIERVQKYKGHFAKAYIDFLELIKDEYSIKYSWAKPSFNKCYVRTISSKNAKVLYQYLKYDKDITKEIKIIKGTLKDYVGTVDRWTIEADNIFYKGTVSDETEDLFSKETFYTNQKYEFECEEILDYDKNTGDEKVTYKLLRYRHLG